MARRVPDLFLHMGGTPCAIIRQLLVRSFQKTISGGIPTISRFFESFGHWFGRRKDHRAFKAARREQVSAEESKKEKSCEDEPRVSSFARLRMSDFCLISRGGRIAEIS